jgi:hypothetical protein
LPGDPQRKFVFISITSDSNALLVFSVHDLSFWTHPEFSTEQNRLSCQKGTLDAVHSADAFLFFSEISRNDFLTLFPGPKRVHSLPMAVLPLASRFSGVLTARTSFLEGPWLSVGSTEPRKNFDLLLDAYTIYQERSNRRRKLCLAGGKGASIAREAF